MKIETYETLCQLDTYKKLYPNDKILYSLLEKYSCIYGCDEWFYKSIENLSKVSGICKSSISRSKKRLIYYGFIKIKKYYTQNGHRGVDYLHLNTLKEVLEHLQKDISNSKDINRLINTLKIVELKTTKTTENVDVV
jgi:hypothetical protein